MGPRWTKRTRTGLRCITPSVPHPRTPRPASTTSCNGGRCTRPTGRHSVTLTIWDPARLVRLQSGPHTSRRLNFARTRCSSVILLINIETASRPLYQIETLAQPQGLDLMRAEEDVPNDALLPSSSGSPALPPRPSSISATLPAISTATKDTHRGSVAKSSHDYRQAPDNTLGPSSWTGPVAHPHLHCNLSYSLLSACILYKPPFRMSSAASSAACSAPHTHHIPLQRRSLTPCSTATTSSLAAKQDSASSGSPPPLAIAASSVV